MPLETLDLVQMRNELHRAMEKEVPLLHQIRADVRRLALIRLGYRQCYAIAPVATDGGENRFTFDPINLEVIRVVDSEGNERFQRILPLSMGFQTISDMFDPNSPNHEPILIRFLEKLNLDSYKELSYILETEPGNKDLRIAVRPFRDIVEWAVLLEMAWNPGKSKLLLMRDGLLRTKALRKDIMPILGRSFESAYKETGSLLVGVAKRSKIINYLSLAMYLEKTIAKNFPCFCEVPPDLEAKAYVWADSWLGGHSFGKLHLAKLVEHSDGLVLPIDIPSWLIPRRKEVLEYLAETAKASFPTLGYPEPLVKAHENAALHGLEMTVLESMMLDALIDTQSTADSDRTMEHVAFGRGIQKGGWKEYG